MKLSDTEKLELLLHEVQRGTHKVEEASLALIDARVFRKRTLHNLGEAIAKSRYNLQVGDSIEFREAGHHTEYFKMLIDEFIADDIEELTIRGRYIKANGTVGVKTTQITVMQGGNNILYDEIVHKIEGKSNG